MDAKHEFSMVERGYGSGKVGSGGVWEAIFNALADLPEAHDTDQVRLESHLLLDSTSPDLLYRLFSVGRVLASIVNSSFPLEFL